MRATALQLRVRRSRTRGGFTLMELILGMIVTGLVMIAVAALLSAVARGWEYTGTVQSSTTHRVQSHTRIQRVLKGAKQLGALRPGSIDGDFQGAGVMLWMNDDNLDEKVQFSELGLLVHEGGIGTPDGYLALYDVSYPSSWTAAQKTTADTPALADDEIYEDSNIDTFRTLAHVRMTLVASNVVGCVFTLKDGADITRPTLDYMLKFDKDNDVHVEYGTVSVRTASELPVSQR